MTIKNLLQNLATENFVGRPKQTNEKNLYLNSDKSLILLYIY